MTNVLDEKMLITLMREAYQKHLQNLQEFDTSGFGDDKHTVLDVGLKIRHNKTNLLYTISQLGIDDIVLMTPDGEEFTVSRKELEKEYKLD